MVAVAMGQHDMGHAPGGRSLVGHESRVAGEERINQHGLRGEIEPKGGVAIPGDLHDGGPWLGDERVAGRYAMRRQDQSDVSCPAKAGHPITPVLSVLLFAQFEPKWLLGHPLSRATTPVETIPCPPPSSRLSTSACRRAAR